MPITKFKQFKPVKCKHNNSMPKIIKRDVIMTTTIGIEGDLTLSSLASNEINRSQILIE